MVYKQAEELTSWQNKCLYEQTNILSNGLQERWSLAW